MRRSHGYRACCAVFLMAFCSAFVFSQAVSSTVVGTVTDSTHAVIVNASVTLTETSTNVSRITHTNESGNFGFSDVPPGNYAVTVEIAGFKKEQQRGISLLVNSTQRVDVR